MSYEAMSARIRIDMEKIAEFCRRWKVTEFALFGSVLRDDFRTDSDVDVLVSFSADAHPSIHDLIQMENDLKEMFQRNVDLVTRLSVEQSENYIRRKHILSNLELLYAA